jgi:hypothetical protein
MNSRVTLGYFLVPAVVFLTLGGLRRLGWDDLIFFLPSYVIFAAPQIVWAVLTRFVGVGKATAHAGYLGATAGLLSLHLWFECCENNSSALGWLLYWPLAATLMIVAVGGVAAWKTWQTHQP